MVLPRRQYWPLQPTDTQSVVQYNITRISCLKANQRFFLGTAVFAFNYPCSIPQRSDSSVVLQQLLEPKRNLK